MKERKSLYVVVRRIVVERLIRSRERSLIHLEKEKGERV